MYWIKDGVMSLMALGLSAIVLGVAISYCLHVLIHYYYVGDAEKLLRDESTPVFMGCITTVGAFMGLLFTESDLLRDFGLFATFSLIGNTFFALVFLPHFLHKDQIIFKRTHGFPLVEKFNNLPWDRNKWVISLLVVLIIVGVIMSPRVKFDSDLGNLDYDNATLAEAQNLYNTKNADGFAHAYFAAWDEKDMDKAMAYNADFYVHLDSLQKAGIIKGYSPISGLLFRSQEDQQIRIATWKGFWTRARIAQLRRDLTESARAYQLPANLFDPFFALLRQKYEPGNLIEADIVPPGLLANFYEAQESGRQMFFTEISYPKEDQNRVWHAVTEAKHVIVLEPFFYCRDMVEIIHDDFSTTLWISSIFVLLVLLFSFRNIWIALIAFMPMFVSWYVMQGYMAIFKLEFNLINIVISTFIYGIGVDYSIFVMEGLLAEARRGETSMLNYHKVAIFYSAMVLAIVTFSLVFARHPAIHSIGLITLIGMASTILITYSLQPFIFRQLCKYRFFRRGFRIPEP
jgi:predicted exporter